jgi:transcriptional regulator with XRE-family HTH domain
MASLAENLGKRIAQLREEKGFDRDELGARIGLSASMLGYLERGSTNTRTEVLERLAVALDVEPADLLVFPWGDDEGEDGEIPPRHYARELIRVIATSKLSGLLEVMRAYVEANTAVASLLSRRARKR